MRTQLLPSLAVAALAAGALSLAAPTPAASAVGWTHTDDITTTASTNASSRPLDVVAYGHGFAAAVWMDGTQGVRRITASRFQPNVNGGEWSDPTPLSTAGRNTYDATVEANDHGDLVATWTESHDGVEEVYAAVQPVGGLWSEPTLLTPGADNVLNGIDIGIANDRTVYAAASYKDADDATFGLRIVEWAYPAAPESPLQVAADARLPSVDVSGTGEVVLAFKNEAQDHYAYTTHSAGDGWTAALSLGPASPVTPAPAATVAGDGRGAVAFVSDDANTARVQRIAADGTKHGSVKELETGVPMVSPAVDIDNAGRLAVAWAGTDENGPALGHASSVFGGAWTIGAHPSPLTGAHSVEAELADNGALGVGYAYGDQQVVLHRPRPTAPFSEWVSDPGYASYSAIGTDLAGNVIALGAPLGAEVPVHARYLDTVGPSTVTDDWPVAVLETERVLSPTVSFETSGHDWLSGLASVDVVARIARWNEAGYAPRKVLLNDQPSGSTNLPVQPGASYCVAARGTDGVGNLGEVGKETCFTTPLDDRAFTATGWAQPEADAHYLGTITSTTTKGRVLLRKGVQAKSLALVVAKSPTGGKVQVRLGDDLLGTYSLEGTGTKRIIPVAGFAQVRTGALRITVVTEGKPVKIDGVVITK